MLNAHKNAPPSYPFSSQHNILQLPPSVIVLPTPLLIPNLADIETKPTSIQIHLVGPRLQNACNRLRVLELSQIHVRSALLDRITDQLGRAGLTLCAHDRGLLLLPRFVDDEGSALRFLLCDLFGFDGGRELGGEGEMLKLFDLASEYQAMMQGMDRTYC